MADQRTSAEIEREIEEERAGLARSLDDLQRQFTPEAVMNTATDYFRRNDIGRTLARQVRDNPLAVAVTGIGLAWLIFGSNRTNAASHHYHDVGRDDPDYDAAFGRETGYGVDDTPFRRDPEPRIGYDDRDYDAAPGHLAEPPVDGFEERVERADGARGRDEFTMNADHGLRDAEVHSDEPSNYDRARAKASSARTKVYAKSAEMRARMSEGTEHMSEQARARVMRARRKAAEAQREMERRFGEYKASGRSAFDDQPLVAGLIALGIGAAIGAALPRTRREDEMLGAYRDRALDEANRIFQEESGKLRAVAEAAIDEARDIGEEAAEEARSRGEAALDQAEKAMHDADEKTPSGKEAVDKAEGAVKSAADRVANAAKEEADKQDLGGSVKS
jgi:hypothetical protein